MIIALIDKFPILRKGLTLHIQAAFDDVVVLASETTEIFQKEYPNQNPDLIIIGINQHPNTGDTKDIKLVKKLYQKCKIILYDEKPDPDMIENYLQAEVNGYISKQNTVSELGECILTVLKGERYICMEVLDSVFDKNLVKENASPKDNMPE